MALSIFVLCLAVFTGCNAGIVTYGTSYSAHSVDHSLAAPVIPAVPAVPAVPAAFTAAFPAPAAIPAPAAFPPFGAPAPLFAPQYNQYFV